MTIFFWKISGGDAAIIQRCNAQTRLLFSCMGAFIAIIFVVTFWAFCYSLFQVFDDSGAAAIVLAVLLALFFSLLIGTIYLFLVTTFSKNQLPVKRHPRTKFFSFFIRIGFLVFMGILVSKPIEIHLLDSHLQKTVLQNAQGSAVTEHGFGYKLKMVATAKEYAWTWWFSFIFIALYLTPIMVKLSLPAKEEYYAIKTQMEQKLVDREYEQFKKTYAGLMAPLGTNISFYEPFDDAPYNTRRKKDARVFDKSNEDLLQWLT